VLGRLSESKLPKTERSCIILSLYFELFVIYIRLLGSGRKIKVKHVECIKNMYKTLGLRSSET